MNTSRDYYDEKRSHNNLSFSNCKDKSPFHGLLLNDNNKRGNPCFLKDEIPFLTPVKNKDQVSRISLTPISIAKNMRGTSPITGFKRDRY